MTYTSCYCGTLLFIIMMVEANILSGIEDWNMGTFYEYGSPTLSEELIFQMEKIYTLTPVFFVIKSSLPQEGNVYVKLVPNNINDTIFRFYEGRHPNYPNYKFQVNSTKIVYCQNLDNNNCEELDLCEHGKVVNENASDNNTGPIFLSWKVVEKTNISHNDVTILFQYKDRVVKCRDFRAFKIKKIVVESRTVLDIKSKSMFYKYTRTTENKTITLENFQINSSVALYVRYCRDCKFSFTLNCNNKNTTKETNNSSFPFIEFRQNGSDNEGVASRSWQKVILSASDKNCSLSITPEELLEGRDTNTKKFWAIGFIDPNEKLTTKKFTEHSNSSTSNEHMS